MTSKQLREQRADLHNKATAILTRASGEKRNLTAEERQEFDRYHAEIESLRGDIERVERQDSLDKELATNAAKNPPVEDRRAPTGELTEEYRELGLRTWLLRGSRAKVTAEGVEAAERCGYDMSNIDADFRFVKRAPKTLGEARALTTTTAASGGAIIAPTSFVREIESALLAYSSMRELATVIRTDKGETITLPTAKDTNNKGEILKESGDVNTADPTFALVSFAAYTYSSKMIQLPFQLLQDSDFPLEPFLGDKLAERIARIQQDHFTTGHGASQPQGVATAAAVGVTAASATAVTYAELLALKHSVDPAYRANARFMANDSTILKLKQLTDSTGRPLWATAIAAGAPDTIDGSPFVVNQSMASMTTGQRSILFGNFSKYFIRDVTGFQVQRLNERYADKGQVAFLLFARCDAGLVDAGSNPIKCLVQA